MKSKDYIKFYGDNRIDFASLLMKKGFEFCFDSDEYPGKYYFSKNKKTNSNSNFHFQSKIFSTIFS